MAGISGVQLQKRRGTSTQIASFIGAPGELIVDTTNNRVAIQDGATAGGFEAAKITEVARLVVSITGVDFNSGNTDNAITVPLPPGFTTYLVAACIISNASHTLTTATCGLFSAAAGGGTAIVATGTAITVSATAANTNNNAQSLTIVNAGTQSWNVATLYFRVQTAEGSAATGTVTLHVYPLF